uniref:hypothetical protein n=1 Tax=Polaromonas sp. TaxID=1869339 RepID=UPI0015EE4640|nr:hypothetical protein [Polaromonas sp.]
MAVVVVVSVFWINLKLHDAAEEKLQIAAQKAEKQLQDARSSEASIAAAGAVIQATADMLNLKCTSGVMALVTPAKEALLRGHSDEALKLLKPCAHLMTDKEALRTYATAVETLLSNERKYLASEKTFKKSNGVSIGMTKKDVLDSSWGRAKHINRTTNSHGVYEQWVYGNGSYLYFENEILTSFQN